MLRLQNGGMPLLLQVVLSDPGTRRMMAGSDAVVKKGSGRAGGNVRKER